MPGRRRGMSFLPVDLVIASIPSACGWGWECFDLACLVFHICRQRAPCQVPIMAGLTVRPVDSWHIRDNYRDSAAWAAASDDALNKPLMKNHFIEHKALSDLLGLIDPKSISDQASKFHKQHESMQQQLKRGSLEEVESLKAIAAPKKRRGLLALTAPEGEPGAMQSSLPAITQ